MLKRPSARRRGKSKEEMELNLVPIIDVLVTLIAFMLFSISLLQLVSVDSFFPFVDRTQSTQNSDKLPLQLTISVSDQDTEIWSPFYRDIGKKIPHQNPDLVPSYQEIHDYLVQVKMKYPSEDQVVLLPQSGTNYDTMITLMDTVRLLQPTDPVIMEAGNPQAKSKYLFQKVVFGNLLGDS